MKVLYQCPACGHVDHDEQDGTGHIEQGTSNHLAQPGWSWWLLACSLCGEVNDMRQVDQNPKN